MGISVSLFHHQPTHWDFDSTLTVKKKPSYGATLLELDGPMETFLRRQVVLEAGGKKLTLSGFHNIIFGKRGLDFNISQSLENLSIPLNWARETVSPLPYWSLHLRPN